MAYTESDPLFVGPAALPTIDLDAIIDDFERTAEREFHIGDPDFGPFLEGRAVQLDSRRARVVEHIASLTQKIQISDN